MTRMASAVLALPPRGGGGPAEGVLTALIAGRTTVGWVVETLRRGGHPVRALLGDIPDGDGVPVVPAPSGSALKGLKAARRRLADVDHLLVVDGLRPLLLPASFERLVSQHLCDGAELTVLADAPGETVSEEHTVAYCARTPWLWEQLGAPVGDSLLDLVGRAVETGATLSVTLLEPGDEGLRVEDMATLARAETVLRWRINRRLLASGVRMVDPATTYVDDTVRVEPRVVLQPATILRGRSHVARGAEIGPNSIVIDSEVGRGCRIAASVLEGATLEEGVHVGPFSHLRPGARIGPGVHIGNYVEVKNARLGRGTRVGHFSYLGDAEVGEEVNIGAGTITCNYDGKTKHRTIIERGAFIGSDTMLIAPVRVGAGALTGAGSVVTRDVPPGARAVGAPARLLPPKGPSPTSEGAESAAERPWRGRGRGR